MVTVVVSACVPRVAMQGNQNRSPAIEMVGGAEKYVTRDGLALGLTHWDAPETKAVIVALHGMSDYANAFALPAAWWEGQGITTYAFDQRGFGRSPNPGLWPDNDVMRRDLDDFVLVARARHPGVPVYVLGESMGGAVAITAFAAERPPQADGLILISPAVWGQSTLPFYYRAVLWTVTHSFPWMSLSGSGLKIMPCDNIELLRANYRDPLMQKSARSDAVYGLVGLMDEANAEAAEVKTTPLLFLYGGNDQVIPKSATENVVKELGANATVKKYPKGYHMLLRDLEAAPRWADIADWIESRIIPSAGGGV